MSEASVAADAEQHLREVWEVLVRERQRTLARVIEGVLAELTDETLQSSNQRANAAREWRAVLANPRGLSDFGIWREEQDERLRLNQDFEAHIRAITKLLG